MDWNLAIEKNREALKRIVAMLVAMAGLGTGHSAIAGRQSEPAQAADGPTAPDCLLPTAHCRMLLPRHLHRAILRLLRPAESAARRLVIVMARGLVVTLPPARPRKAKPRPTILRKPGGTGILMPSGSMPRARTGPRTLALPLLDQLRPFRPRRPAQNGIPRISFPGYTAPSPVALRRPPAADDLLDATRLALRLQALGAALDDLPRQAKRFARWRALRASGRIRRVWPLRPGRPPGQRRPNRRTHEVHEILNDLHGLAFDVLEHPDTS
jgi:hypothetical protein